MKTGMTRRQLAGALLAATAAAPAPPQAPPAAPAGPAEELQAARERNKGTGESLAAVSVPMDTEPAFHFTA